MLCASEFARLRPSDVKGIELIDDRVPEGIRDVGDPSKE
jgi:hypothetical protein